jgi:hypothetical protein
MVELLSSPSKVGNAKSRKCSIPTYYVPFFLKAPEAESSVSQVSGIKMLHLTDPHVKFRQRLGVDPEPSSSDCEEEEEEEKEPEGKELRKKKKKHRTRRQENESKLGSASERPRTRPREESKHDSPVGGTEPGQPATGKTEPLRLVEDDRPKRPPTPERPPPPSPPKEVRRPAMAEPDEPPDHDQTQGSADYGGLSSECDSEESDLRYRRDDTRKRDREDQDDHEEVEVEDQEGQSHSSRWKPRHSMTDEEKRKANYEARQRKRQKRDAARASEPGGKLKGKQKGKGKNKGKDKSKGKGKKGKSRSNQVTQLERFGCLRCGWI